MKGEKIKMICKDCIHFEVCDSGRHIGEYVDDDGVYAEGVEKECVTFKDKSRFIELPCKVGSDVYLILEDDEVETGIYVTPAHRITEVGSQGFWLSAFYPPGDDSQTLLPGANSAKPYFLPERKRKRLWRRGFYDRANERLRESC